MGLIKFLANSTLDSMKRGMNELNQAMQEFELDDIDEMFDRTEKRLTKEMNKLKKRFSNTETAFTINIPYNRNTSTLVTDIRGHQFIAIVTTDETTVEGASGTTSSRQMTFDLPNEVIVETQKMHYDDANHLMYFTFAKKEH